MQVAHTYGGYWCWVGGGRAGPSGCLLLPQLTGSNSISEQLLLPLSRHQQHLWIPTEKANRGLPTVGREHSPRPNYPLKVKENRYLYVIHAFLQENEIIQGEASPVDTRILCKADHCWLNVLLNFSTMSLTRTHAHTHARTFILLDMFYTQLSLLWS